MNPAYLDTKGYMIILEKLPFNVPRMLIFKSGEFRFFKEKCCKLGSYGYLILSKQFRT